MAVANIQSNIIRLGTEAVLRYRTIAAITSDSDLPEVFLGGFIASRLYDEIRCSVHIERPYTKMAAELGIEINQELKNKIGGQRADIAIYQGGLPSHIVEFKIFDEGTQPTSIISDLEKAKELANNKPISVVLGFMICQTSSKSLAERIEELRSKLSPGLACGEPQPSVDRKWNWCFGCSYWVKNEITN